VTLPVVTYDEDMEKLISNTDDKMSFNGIKQPVTSTFSLFEKYVIDLRETCRHVGYERVKKF
jgi:hypothetical protein